MTVYVDDMHKSPMGNLGFMKMSHMMADTDRELHAMADAIGLKRDWFQGDHYDVSKAYRAKAVELGAVEVTMRQLARMRMARRKRGGGPLIVPVTDS